MYSFIHHLTSKQWFPQMQNQPLSHAPPHHLPHNHRILGACLVLLGMCHRETRTLQPILCLVLSNTGSLHLSEECNAQAIGGKCDLSG